MKKIISYSVFFIISIVCISCGVYDISSWDNYNESIFPISEGVKDSTYIKSIKLSKAYIKDSPKRINVPSFSIAVGIDGKVVWSEAVGYSDLELKTPAKTETQYRIGSTSKAVTASLAMRLYEQNRFDLNKNLNGTINNYPKKKWGFNAKQLLSHTAGLPDYSDLKLGGLYRTTCNCKNYSSVTEALKVFNKVKLQYQPGTEYKYNSFDIVLVSAYIEGITKNPFLETLSTELLQPLDMNNTLGDNAINSIQPNTIFYKSKKPLKFKEWKTLGFFFNDINLSYKWAGGGLLSTPTDLVKMGNAILTDSSFISNSTKEVFFEHQKLDNGEFNADNYALGWRTDRNYNDEKFGKKMWIVHHGGVSKGSMNFLVLFPEYDMAINASINARAENFGYLWGEVMQVASYFIQTMDTE
ncbi:MAG: serine hydrolase domain-containing protein [Winogradskyella sp.]